MTKKKKKLNPQTNYIYRHIIHNHQELKSKRQEKPQKRKKEKRSQLLSRKKTENN